MADITDNQEGLLVGVGVASGAVAAYLVEAPIPLEIKTPLVTVFGVVSVAILAFWKSKVNKPVA